MVGFRGEGYGSPEFTYSGIPLRIRLIKAEEGPQAITEIGTSLKKYEYMLSLKREKRNDKEN